MRLLDKLASPGGAPTCRGASADIQHENAACVRDAGHAVRRFQFRQFHPILVDGVGFFFRGYGCCPGLRYGAST